MCSCIIACFYLSIYLISIYLSTYLSIYLSIYLSTYLPTMHQQDGPLQSQFLSLGQETCTNLTLLVSSGQVPL